MFSVNRFGSNYIFSETTEKFLDDVYANKPKDLVVTEVNVDSLVFNGISYGLDGTKKELKAGSDYTVKQKRRRRFMERIYIHDQKRKL